MRENKNARPALSQRRSQRIVLSAPVVVSGTCNDQHPAEREMNDRTGRDRAAFDEKTETISVSFHGAMILLSAPVKIGQTVCLRHGKTQEEAQAEVRYVGGRQAGKTQVGIQFCKPAAHFWYLTFPPDDWSAGRTEIEQTSD